MEMNEVESWKTNCKVNHYNLLITRYTVHGRGAKPPIFGKYAGTMAHRITGSDHFLTGDATHVRKWFSKVFKKVSPKVVPIWTNLQGPVQL